VPKISSTLFAAYVMVALASTVVIPNPAAAAAPMHHDQVPGFYRIQVGDLEVTALWDGTASFDPHWLQGQTTIDGAVMALHEDPHLLDVADTGFLVNTGKQLILIDAGSGTWGDTIHAQRVQLQRVLHQSMGGETVTALGGRLGTRFTI
jgi:hypothetical protein